MSKRTILLLSLGSVAVLSLAVVLVASAVSGAAFTTFNPWVDGDGKDVCKNSIINCNIYGAKEYVWLNGGPAANGLGTDGEYFFAVLVPGGQPDPNDEADGGTRPEKNLSDDFDCYENRKFTVTDGEVSAYTGQSCGDPYPFQEAHWLDSGDTLDENRKVCHNGNQCGNPDDKVPFIRLFPYSDTTNPGGVYILAICSLENDIPVSPRDCKYDAFKVKEGRVTYDFFLEGYKIHDLNADGDLSGEPGLAGWEINITGTGFLGEDINETVITENGNDPTGYWSYQSVEYTFTGQDKPVTAHLTVCEGPQNGWYQSAPDSGCYTFDIDPQGVTFKSELDFGNYQKVDVTACKVKDTDFDESTTDDQVAVEGWELYLFVDDIADSGNPYLTGLNGCHTWFDLDPGHSYKVVEEERYGWVPLGNTWVSWDVLSGDGPLSHTFANTPAQGCTPGFWQGGPDKADPQAGGARLWDGDPFDAGYPISPDPDWVASGGSGLNPFIHATQFSGELTFFTTYDIPNDGTTDDYNMFVLVDTGGGSENWRKAARSLVAAYLNASWGMAYPYATSKLEAMWAVAVANPNDTDTGFLALHTDLDLANNHFNLDEGSCPISASGW